MPSDLPFPDLCRHAAQQAGFAIGQLMQADDSGDLQMNETPLLLADALRSTLQAASAGRGMDDADAQLLGALERYLDGWAG